MQGGPNRLISLDVLRGIAVTMVLGWHYFSDPTYAVLFPFGDTLFSLFKYGAMGVNLFFIISGFVIALTLDASPTPLNFIRRRFCRLWPALTFWAIVAFVLLSVSSSPFAQHRPHWFDLLPSLTLIPGAVFAPFFPQIDLVNGTYWTLLVEVQFYLVAAAIFFVGSRKNLARNLVIFTIANLLVRAAILKNLPASEPLYHIFVLTSFMPWFAAGAIFYEWFEQKMRPVMAVTMVIAMFLIIARSATFASIDRPATTIIAISAGLFFPFILISAHSPAIGLIQNEVFRRIGRWSYSIYLLHFPIGMVAISEIPKSWPFIMQILLVTFVFFGAVFLGALSFTYVETLGSKWLDRKLLSLWHRPSGPANPGALSN
jgi:peptidoglycan/LPS O-acetylase OafA/YrhL